MDYKNHKISFRVWGRQALFTDPVTKIGGEKFSYQVPTYEAIKGIIKSIYWKPTLIWCIDRIRVMKPIRTQSKSTKPLDWNGGNTLAIYTFLQDVEYQVEAHFEWNEHWEEFAGDRNFGKHIAIAERMLERGGRQDIFSVRAIVKVMLSLASLAVQVEMGKLVFTMKSTTWISV